MELFYVFQLDHMQVHGGSSLAIQNSSSPNMETGVLLHNIQRIIQVGEGLSLLPLSQL